MITLKQEYINKLRNLEEKKLDKVYLRLQYNTEIRDMLRKLEESEEPEAFRELIEELKDKKGGL